MRWSYPLVVSLVFFLAASLPAPAGGAAVFPDGSVLEQSGAAFLCLPGQPEAAQDQTSGICEVNGTLYSVGDDSGQIFRFAVDPPYLNFCEGLRVPHWRGDLDLEELTYLAPVGEFVVSFENRDTKLQFVRVEGATVALNREVRLELPPSYQRGGSIGPEGLAFDPESRILMVGWEGFPAFRGPWRYLSLYRLHLGEHGVTSVDFLRHVRLPDGIRSCCGLYFDPELRALLVLDRNRDVLCVFPRFSPLALVEAKAPRYSWNPRIEISFQGIRDGLGREYCHLSFEGVTVGADGTLYLVTDPWRSPDFSTYRPLDEAQLDSYYRSYVPQLVWFRGFRERLGDWIAFRYW